MREYLARRRLHKQRRISEKPSSLPRATIGLRAYDRTSTTHGNYRSCIYSMASVMQREREAIDVGALTNMAAGEIVRELRDFWLKFFQKHKIWLICPLWPTVSIFAGRQDERPLACRHFEKTKMSATSAQTCMIPLFRCTFGRIIRFWPLFYDLASRSPCFEDKGNISA